jgi:uncharacterized membrane protein YhaH (DUF805 family)
MNDKLSKAELEALGASTKSISPNSIAYNLHIRSKLARRCFYGFNICALAFLFASGTDVMEGWLTLVDAPPEEGVTDLRVRTLLIFLFFLWVNLALTFDRLYVEALASALSVYLYAIATRFSQFYEYLTLDDFWPFSLFVLLRLIPLALLIVLVKEEVHRTAPDRAD